MGRGKKTAGANRPGWIGGLSDSGALPPSADPALLSSLASKLKAFAERLPPGEQAALELMLAAASPPDDLPAQPEAILSPEETAIYRRLADEPGGGGGLRSQMVMVMKATRLCNLRCSYCHFWADGPNQVMSFEVLARATRDVLRAPGVRLVDFVWHGGETTLLPLSFFRKAIWLQRRFRQPHQKILNSLQTNGTLLTGEWLEFCRRFGFGVGVSLDGPPELHDRRRRDASGKPTLARVRRALDALRVSGLEHSVLMVVDEDVVALGARRVLDYFLEIGVRDVGLLNVLPENTPTAEGQRGSWLAWERFVDFLRDLFRLWWPRYADRISFRELADLLGKLRGGPAATCYFADNCMGGFLTVEPSGQVSACDKYLGDPDYLFGNVREMNLADLAASSRLARAAALTDDGVRQTAACEWFDVCRGACPHDRYLRNRRMVHRNEECCGLAPLLSEMAETLAETDNRHTGARPGQTATEEGRIADGTQANQNQQGRHRVGGGKTGRLRRRTPRTGAGRTGVDSDPGPSGSGRRIHRGGGQSLP